MKVEKDLTTPWLPRMAATERPRCAVRTLMLLPGLRARQGCRMFQRVLGCMSNSSNLSARNVQLRAASA